MSWLRRLTNNNTPVNTEVLWGGGLWWRTAESRSPAASPYGAQSAASTYAQSQRTTPSAYCQGRLKRGGRDSNPQPPARQAGTGVSQGQQQAQVVDSAKTASPAASPYGAGTAPQLDQIVAAWPALSDAMKAGIVAMVVTSTKKNE